MRAMVVDRTSPQNLRIAEVDDPVPGPHEVLARIAAASLNPGEIAHAQGSRTIGLRPAPDGTVLGADAAGTVVRAASDGSGPEAGTSVVTMGSSGGWAELRAVSTSMLGAVPAGADLGAVSTVPVAGLSALRGLRRIGELLGRRVLVTGASGGVGRYAVQLASLAGAEVVALSGNRDRHGASLRALGATDVVSRVEDVKGLVDGVLDQVGGRHLVEAFDKLSPHGTLVSVGHAAGEDETFPFGLMFGDDGRHDRSVVTFFLGAHSDFQDDLGWLARQVAAGRLDAGIVWREDWTQVDDAVAAMAERRLGGKAVIEICP
ncbi:zinc-binding dehydrogenase [Actinotalea sp. K2]|uniref:zinc-binding dehydrogenase n=1 Tax=Actinotalea sp. K2 TaxID=2939438 RepID=UPI002016E74B|nr:zinc-binding dehydrogenase [Actinotalea sp. K2]MCL3862124.1 zinc-binding dehydrogenase [Actinotalea sp. K2]